MLKVLLAIGGAVFAYFLVLLRNENHSSTILEPPKSHQLRERVLISKSTGLWLHTHRWEVSDPKGVVFLIHGWGDHLGRYEYVAKKLNENGLSVVGFDWQGHGMSQGDRGWYSRFEHLVVDAEQAIKEMVVDKFDESLPKFLMAHSMGGAIAVELMSRKVSSVFTGLITSGALLKAHPKLAEPWKVSVANFAGDILPRLGLGVLDPNDLSTLEENRDFYVQDPLVYKGFLTARAAQESLRVMSRGINFKSLSSIPILALHGQDDRVCDPEGSKDLIKGAQTSGNKDAQVKILPNLRHEILFEGEHAPISEIIDWIQSHS